MFLFVLFYFVTNFYNYIYEKKKKNNHFVSMNKTDHIGDFF